MNRKVQETGWHLVFECPVNKESRKANIDGAQTWEDLDNKERVRWRLSLEMPPR